MLELTEELKYVDTKTSASRRVLFVGVPDKSSFELMNSLTEQGFQVREVVKFSLAIDTLYDFIPDVIILDSCNNELSALEFCISAKSIGNLKQSVVIILSDRKDELMELAAFNSGADDFIISPVKVNALVSRIKGRLKTPGRAVTIIHQHEGTEQLKIDRESYSVWLGNNSIQLSRKEFELLYLFASHPEKLFKREELFQAIWNKKTIGKNRTLDVHVSRLRQKLGKRFISSQKGIGYRFMS